MFHAFQVLTVVLVATAFALSLGHAAEMPGKLRLSKEAYLAVQPIYYPGFTIGGLVGEFGGMLAVLLLLVLSRGRSEAFWWTAAAFASLLVMHLIYWVWTHPVNNFWLREQPLAGAGKLFFSVGARSQDGQPADWTQLRNSWEYSHVARAAFALLGLVLLVIAVTI